MLQTLEVTGYMYNRLQLLPQNSFENVDLPVPVENRRCSNGFGVKVKNPPQRNSTFKIGLPVFFKK